MADYKTLFLDIDGTILRPDGKIEDSTKRAIGQVQEQGIEVFLATGRPLHEIAYISEQLNIHSFIGYNGAHAIYKDEVVINEPMNESTIRHFINTAKKHRHDMLLYTSSKNIFTSLESPAIKEMIAYLRFQNNKLLSDGDEQGVLSASLISVSEQDLALYHTGDDIHFSPVMKENQDGKNFYDVIRDNVTKGTAIQKLMDRLGFPIESSIAFGDGLNDKEMLAAAGEGFAMGNAHPLLFDYAKHATTSVTEAGVYNGLKKLGLAK